MKEINELNGDIILNLFPENTDTDATISDSLDQIYDKVFQLKISLKGSKPSIWRRVLVPENITFELLHLVIQSMCDWKNSYLFRFKIGENCIRLREQSSSADDLENNYIDHELNNVTIIDRSLFESYDEDEDYLVEYDEDCAYEEYIDEENIDEMVDFKSVVTHFDEDNEDASKIKIHMLEDVEECVYEYAYEEWGTKPWKFDIVLEKILAQDPEKSYPICIRGRGNFPLEDIAGIKEYRELLEIMEDPEHPQRQMAMETLCDSQEYDFDPEYFDIDVTNKNLSELKYSLPEIYWMPANLDAWRKLYEVVEKIKVLSPWKKFNDDNVVAVEIKGHVDMAYVVLFNYGGNEYDIAIYPNHNAYARSIRLKKNANFEPKIISLSYQDCIMCYYDLGEEILDEDLFIKKQLGLPSNNGTLFRALTPGYYQWYLDSDQVNLATIALENFIDAYYDFENGIVNPDLKKGEMIYCYYCEKNKSYSRKTMLSPEIKLMRAKRIIEDELFIERLKRNQKSNVDLSIDLFNIPYPVQEEKSRRPFLPRIWILVNSDTNYLEAQYILEHKEQEEEPLYLILEEYCENNGCPKVIRVRDEWVFAYLEDLCSKAGIELVVDNNLKAANNFVETISKMTF